MLDIREPRTGQTEHALHAGIQGIRTARERQRALGAADIQAIHFGNRVRHPIRHRAIPQVRLPRIEVNQAQLGRDVAESARIVLLIARQVLEHAHVRTETAGDVAAGTPIAPTRQQRVLELGCVRIVVLVTRSQQALERDLRAPHGQIARDPALLAAQIAEALLAKVVRQTVLAHRIEIAPQRHGLIGADIAQHNGEGIAAAVLRRQRPRA